jgi:hypothetical protein
MGIERIEYDRNERMVYSPREVKRCFTFIESWRGLEVWCNKYTEEEYFSTLSGVELAFMRDGNIVAYVDLAKEENDQAWEVYMVKVSRRFSGFGLAPKAYAWMIKRFGIVIKAGESQSPGGRYIWHELAATRDINVVACSSPKARLLREVYSNPDRPRELTTDGVSLYDGCHNQTLYAYGA